VLAASVPKVTLTPLQVPLGLAVPPVRAEPLDRLPGSEADDPFLRLAADWLVGHPANTATAYRHDLEARAKWCGQLGVHPLAAERHHVDLWGPPPHHHPAAPDWTPGGVGHPDHEHNTVGGQPGKGTIYSGSDSEEPRQVDELLVRATVEVLDGWSIGDVLEAAGYNPQNSQASPPSHPRRTPLRARCRTG